MDVVVDVSNIGLSSNVTNEQIQESSTIVDTEQARPSTSNDVPGADTGDGIGTRTVNTSNAVAAVPTSRTISFTLTSSPAGASIIIDGVDSKFITPHVLKFTETELLKPKIISLINGTYKSTETYIISSEVFTTTTDGSTTPPVIQPGANP
jgi:hypothetical protein